MAPPRGGRPLKRWRYVAAFSEELMLCAAAAGTFTGALPGVGGLHGGLGVMEHHRARW